MIQKATIGVSPAGKCREHDPAKPESESSASAAQKSTLAENAQGRDQRRRPVDYGTPSLCRRGVGSPTRQNRRMTSQASELGGPTNQKV